MVSFNFEYLRILNPISSMSQSNKAFTRRDFSRIIVGVVIILISFFSIGAVGAFAQYTLVNRWIPFLISFFIAAATGLTLWRIWRRFTDIQVFWVNYLCHLICVTCFCWGAFYLLNSTVTIRPAHPEDVVIERKYTVTRYHTRRVGRRSVGRGAPYTVYKVKARFPDGAIRSFELPGSRYKQLRKGRSITINIRRGIFGAPVIEKI